MSEKLTRIQNQSALIVRLRGGLGNQLFQYAAGRSIAARSRVPLMLDTKSGFLGDPNGRSYLLGAFELSNTALEADSTGYGFRVESRRRLLHRYEILRLQLLGKYFAEPINRLRVSGPTVLDAYCQCPRYFGDMADALRKDLAFKAIPADLDLELANEMRRSNSVCVHARRLLGVCSDATKTRPSVVSYYGACGIRYYQTALSRLVSEYGQLNAYLFSDDITWARENAQSLAVEGCTVKVIEEEDTLKTFYLMQLCKHFVLANSTFGWWAAWLGECAGNTVLIPSVWNQGEKRFPSDMFPESWKIVPAA
jgi:hypothetical protein